jgi:hypothetical protein
MKYSLTIEHMNSDPTYVNDIKTWPQVTYYLRKRLDQRTTSVHIYKWSSNNRCLGEKWVTMSNICDVAFALRDKVLL